MHLSYTTILQLELLFNIKNQSVKQSVFDTLNRTHTIVGKRMLRSFLLAPSSDQVLLPSSIHA